MATIRYWFVDGTSVEVEVEDSFAMDFEAVKHKQRLVNRKETRRHQGYEEGLFSSGNRVDEDFFQSDRGRLLNKILLVLRKKDRELFTLHYIEGASMTEIARARGVSRSAISQQLRRIRNRIIELWQKS